MNIESHFYNADAFLRVAKVMVEHEEYTGARVAISKAYSHTREIIDHVSKLEALKANIELTPRKTGP